MKKIFYSMMAMAIAAFTFTACEDVPEPYNNPYNGYKTEEPVVVDPTGSGTKEDPWNVTALANACEGLAAGDFLNGGSEVYVKGIVVETTEVSAQYGNATYYIADDKNGAVRFYVFRGKLLDGASVTAATDLQVGDEVIVCGKVKNYKPTSGDAVLEFDQGNYLVYLNGKTSGGETPSTDAKAVTVAEFLAAAESTSEWYQLTGTVTHLEDGTYKNSTQYGNFDLVDETGSIYVYGVVAEKGGSKGKFADLMAEKGIKDGSKITIIGNRGAYNGNAQVTNAYFVSVEGGSDTPSGEGGKGTADSPYSVTDALAAGSGTGVYVKAFIVGSVSGQVLSSGAAFSATSDTQTNILIAASADETDVNKCMPVQLPSGAVRTALNLKDNAGNYKKEVTLYGNIEKYFGATGLKTVTFAILDGQEIGTNPGGGNDTPSGDEAKAVSIADFNAAAESNDVWYQLTGTIKNLKDGDQYGNFDLEDETGSVYVYGLLSEKGGAKKLFQDLVTKYGLKEGSKITIIGNRGSYNGKIEVMNAYFVSVESDDNGNGNSQTGVDGSTIITISDFNAAAESNDVWYQLTGTVKNLKDGDQYGNFDLEDSTGSVYVYGVLSEKGGAKKLFQNLVTQYGIKNGTTLTIVGTRGSYNGKIEVMNAYFVSASN